VPLYQIIKHDTATKILIWEITETLEELQNKIVLTNENVTRVSEMKSTVHKCAFLSVRKLLAIENYTDFDLLYDEFGKPHLIDKNHISISHSHQFATIIISKKPVGIDIEMQRNKIIDIANKFTNDTENLFVNLLDIKSLTTIWGAKEAVFKIVNQKGISFKNHLFIDKFSFNNGQTNLLLKTEKETHNFLIFFKEIENFVLVYAFQNQ